MADAGSPPAARTLPTEPAELAEAVLQRNRRALARVITLVENDDAAGHEVVSRVFPRTGSAKLTGITGAPGVGKSTLVGALIEHIRKLEDAKVGVISVDPSSPFSQGAVLGDRIRLTEHFLDPEVFIRSMGTRGHLGGLAEASLQAALLLDAFGKDEVFLETVGVGQSEIEIASIADTVILVLMPGSGDSVQALKAGIMEIPDIIVINKADHPQARTLHQQVRSILLLDAGREWTPPIVETEASNGRGVDTLWERIAEHRQFLGQQGRLEERRKRNLEKEIFNLASARASAELERSVAPSPRLRELLEAVHRRELDPITCVRQLFDEVFRR